MDNVIVWAEKRAAPTREVPIAVSVHSGDDLASAGISDLGGLARRLPALDLQFNAGLTTTSLRVRRVGNIGNIPTFEPAVGVFVDGAYRSRSFLGTSGLLSVDRIEVLRGPQTALYGKSVSGGVVAIHTREPSEELSVEGELTRGWIDAPDLANLGTLSVDLSGPLGPSLRGGIGARLTRHGHTLVNVLPGAPDGNDRRHTAVRGQLSWSPSDALDFRLLSGYMRENDDQGESEVFLAPGAASTQVSDVLQGLGLTSGCDDNLPRNRKLCSVATNELDVDAVDLTLVSEFRSPGDWTLRSTTSWDQYDILRIEDDAIQLFAPILFYRDAEQSRSVQEEVLVESSSEGLKWLAGVFYYRNHYKRGDDGRVPMFGANGELAYNAIWPELLGVPLAVPGQLGIHDSTLATRYVSALGRVSWQLTSRFWLTASLRWQDEKKDAVIDNSVTEPDLSLISAILTPASTLSGEPVNGTLSRTSSGFPWSISPRYRFGDNAMAYFTAARGSKSGGFNTGFGDAPLAEREFDDESIHHYELGAKINLADQRLALDTAVFYTRYYDYQDSAFISAQFSVGNAERVDLEGMEVDASLRWSERLKTDFSVSFADLRYAVNTSGLCYPGRNPDGSSPGSCVLSGEHPIHAPEWETHLGVEYERPVGWGRISVRLDWSWSDGYNTSFSADPRLVIDDYSDIGLRVGLRIGGSHELVLWGDNLRDENVTHFDSLLNLFNDASYQSYFAAPRSYGVAWRFRM